MCCQLILLAVYSCVYYYVLIHLVLHHALAVFQLHDLNVGVPDTILSLPALHGRRRCLLFYLNSVAT